MRPGRWYEVSNTEEAPSPALVVYADRLRRNLERMVDIAGGTERLRPHVKTHKIPEIIRLQLELGISRFKCATLAEAAMMAACGAEDVLVAYPLVGPSLNCWTEMVAAFPRTAFSVIVDDLGAARELSRISRGAGIVSDVLLDLDVGMHRTGVAPDERAFQLCRELASIPGIRLLGLHAYDGHIRDVEVEARTRACEEAMGPVHELRTKLQSIGLSKPQLVAGGTPTFAIQARRPDVECSPGTCVFWDAGYGAKFADLDFLPAALVMTRVVSRPSPTRLCLDLGYKAIASEMPHPRVQFLDLPDAQPVLQSEEHLVIETTRAQDMSIGACLYGIPWHICPTVALYEEAIVVREGRAEERWRVTARDRSVSRHFRDSNPSPLLTG